MPRLSGLGPGEGREWAVDLSWAGVSLLLGRGKSWGEAGRVLARKIRGPVVNYVGVGGSQVFVYGWAKARGVAFVIFKSLVSKEECDGWVNRKGTSLVGVRAN